MQAKPRPRSDIMIGCRAVPRSLLALFDVRRSPLLARTAVRPSHAGKPGKCRARLLKGVNNKIQKVQHAALRPVGGTKLTAGSLPQPCCGWALWCPACRVRALHPPAAKPYGEKYAREVTPLEARAAMEYLGAAMDGWGVVSRRAQVQPSFGLLFPSSLPAWACRCCEHVFARLLGPSSVLCGFGLYSARSHLTQRKAASAFTSRRPAGSSFQPSTEPS